MTEVVRAAEAIRAAGRIFEEVLRGVEQSRVAYDPGYDVEFVEDLSAEFASDEDVNDLIVLARTAQRGGPVKAHRRARRNAGQEARLQRATDNFSRATMRLLAEYRADRLAPDELLTTVRAAFIRQSRVAFLAGKRTMGNLLPMTLEDEREIADVVAAEGLTPGMTASLSSLGGLVRRIATAPALTPAQRTSIDQLDDALDAYVGQMVERVMGNGIYVRSPTAQFAFRFEQIVAKQTALARRRVRAEVVSIRRKALLGAISAEQAVAMLGALLSMEAIRAARRAKASSGGGWSTLTAEEQAALDRDQRSAEGVVATALRAEGMNWGRLLLLAVVAHAVLADSDIRQWLRKRLDRLYGQFFRLAKAGEKAAFRVGGTPAPKPESGMLPGAAVAAPQPSPLEERVIVHWVIDRAVENCIDCIRLRDMSPFYLDALTSAGIHPGSGATRCQTNCRCSLDFSLPVFQVFV